MTRTRLTGNRAWLRRCVLAVFLVAALCRPALPGGTSQAATTDLNVFFVVDTTTSMVAEDYGTSAPRMDGVRQDIMAIAKELPGARFSLITFDTKAFVRMPLTTDTLALQTMVTVLEPQVTAFAKGSSITAARQVLSERLDAARQSHPERPRLVYYLGDGEQTSGKEPERLNLDGSLVAGGAVLGYGTGAGARMKENSGDPGESADGPYVRDGGGADALSRIDEPRLQDVAGQLGLPYVHRQAGDPVGPMMQEARPGSPERSGDSLEGPTELYWLFAAGAFALALPDAVMIIRRYRELPRAASSAPARAAERGERVP
ncbi:Ca-activated chloride channel family protein [Arthrobacter sp. SORGH_AS 212]|uniref:vWA domain-containing protein n=1 Tax=Pseudarthrobacter sp. SORGH_AS 212 TaxID=3041777 RepID=UPI00277D5013|nr:Ca-activated chloride channel family protein [Arthrobacter sp. SORGH_AS_0212]